MRGHQPTDPLHDVFSQIHMPWPIRRHPQAAEYEHLAFERATHLGLLNKNDQDTIRRFECFVRLDASVYPYATIDRLQAAGLFNQWLFFLDDQYDDHPELGRDIPAVRNLMARSLEVLVTGELPADPLPFDRLSVCLREQSQAICFPGWLPRFIRNVEEYLFHGSLVAMHFWNQGSVPDLVTYRTMRMLDSAVLAAIDIIEVAGAVVLPDAVHRHPLVIELRELAAQHVAYVNDIASYQKEVLCHESPCNLIPVLLMKEDLCFEVAVRKAIDVINDVMMRFLKTEVELPSCGGDIDQNLVAYVGGMKTWMRGNIDFVLTSGRYLSPASPFLELRPAASK